MLKTLKPVLVLALVLGLSAPALARPERRDLDPYLVYLATGAEKKYFFISLEEYLCRTRGENWCLDDDMSWHGTERDFVGWDGTIDGRFLEMLTRSFYRLVYGGPRAWDDPHYLALFRQEAAELRNLLRYPVPVTGEVPDLKRAYGANLRWAAFDFDKDPEYAWGVMCG